jgi:hypothetical protein
MEFKDLDPENLEKAANMLKAMAHPIRISIVGYLEDGEQSTASHHLVILKDRGVLASKRDGKNTWYFLKHPNLKAILNSVSECCRE